MATRLNTVINLGLALLVLVLANLLARRLPWRHDLGPAGYHQLSQNSRIMLESLEQDVTITVMMRSDHELAAQVRDLLREYDLASRAIRVNYLDPYRDLTDVQALAGKYPLESADIVLFESGDRRQMIDLDTVAEFDYLPVLYGESRRLKVFHGESAFSSAIHAVSGMASPVVYYLRGHGERDLNNPHPVTGYSKLARLIRDEQMQLRELSLAEAGGIPEDADMVLVLGPRQPLSAAELDGLSHYLENHGKMMVLLGCPGSGMESLLASWGVSVTPGRVGGVTLTRAELFVGDYAEHPVTRNLSGITTVFYRPRPLFRNQKAAPDDPASRLNVSLLAKGRELLDADAALPEPALAATAPAVAAAIEKGQAGGVNERRRQTRILVFGDIDFASNAGMVGGNRILIANALNWLAGREQRLDIAPRFPEKDVLLLSRQHLMVLLMGAGLMIPGLFLIFGMALGYCRGAASA